MKSTDATSLANYFIDLSIKEGIDLRQFGLMKRVYLAHGFTLALFDRPAIDGRFDVVEAWKNGPVIPSVYHSFKHNGNKPITEKSPIAKFENGETILEYPRLNDKEVKDMADIVWERYKDFDDTKLINWLHRSGTPWALCYVEGRNNPIPDLYTKTFYKKLIRK
jgi:uncharacterized phage-associated protein